MRGERAVVPLERATALLTADARDAEVDALHVPHEDPLLAEAALARHAAPTQRVVVAGLGERHV